MCGWVRFEPLHIIGLPAACNTATVVPAATAPPFATAAADIMPAAYEPTVIPAAVNPTAPRTKGAATTAPPRNRLADKHTWQHDHYMAKDLNT